MKIGILTFHCAHNYGAVLQCYALQEVLKGMGHTVEVMDYRPSYLKAPYDIVSFRRIQSRNPIRLMKGMISEFLSLPERIIRHKGFDRFIKEQLCLSAPGIPSDCDAYVMGSDQIWNPGITQGFDGVYFGYLPFPKGHRSYIAYAASMEREALDDSEKNYFLGARCTDGSPLFQAGSSCLPQSFHLLKACSTAESSPAVLLFPESGRLSVYGKQFPSSG